MKSKTNLSACSFPKVKQMIKTIQITAAAIIWLLLSACNKDTMEGRSTNKSSLAFKYNGMQYNLTYVDYPVLEWSASDHGLLINRPDIFNAVISFPRTGCAFSEPYQGAIYDNGNCELLNSSGSAIDSVSIYIYESGTLDFSYTNCEIKQLYDPVTGTNYTRQLCDGNGSFNLALKNKEDNHITISDGIIKIYNQER